MKKNRCMHCNIPLAEYDENTGQRFGYAGPEEAVNCCCGSIDVENNYYDAYCTACCRQQEEEEEDEDFGPGNPHDYGDST